MAFSLKNAPSEFQNIMNDIFNSFSHFTIVSIDDVLVYSNSINEHWKHLYSFLDTIKRNGLVVSAEKIKLFQTKVRFLGYYIVEGQIHPIDRAIQFADKFPDVITNKTQLQRFLGSLNYVADFYKDMRKQCKPLFDRLQSNPPLVLISILPLLNKSRPMWRCCLADLSWKSEKLLFTFIVHWYISLLLFITLFLPI